MFVKVDKKSDILALTIARPEKRNALSHAVVAEMKAALERYSGHNDIKLLLIRGLGDRAFASGGDLDELSVIRTNEAAVAMSQNFREALEAIRNFPAPSIAVLNGDAFGGGAELAVACDLSVAANHVRIGFLQGKLNISTAWGGGVDLIARVGRACALRLLATAEILNAHDAQRIGLIDAVAPENKSFEDYLEEFCLPYRQRTPQVMRAFKALTSSHARGTPRDELLAIETELFAQNWVDEDHWSAVEQSLGAAGRA